MVHCHQLIAVHPFLPTLCESLVTQVEVLVSSEATITNNNRVESIATGQKPPTQMMEEERVLLIISVRSGGDEEKINSFRGKTNGLPEIGTPATVDQVIILAAMMVLMKAVIVKCHTRLHPKTELFEQKPFILTSMIPWNIIDPSSFSLNYLLSCFKLNKKY